MDTGVMDTGALTEKSYAHSRHNQKWLIRLKTQIPIPEFPCVSMSLIGGVIYMSLGIYLRVLVYRGFIYVL